MQKTIAGLLFIGLILSISIGTFAQNAGQQYFLDSYKPTLDSGNYHSSIRDYMIMPVLDLPHDTSSHKRSWLRRKIFHEHLLEYNNEDYNLYLSFLPDFQIGRSSDNGTVWLNGRGVTVGGRLGRNFAFRAEIFENQAKFPLYVDRFNRAHGIVPGQGEFKDYSNGKAFDYPSASALLSYTPSKFVNFQLGYDRNFIGDGYRSVLLSDVPYNYPFLKVTAGAGKLKYSMMWAQFIDQTQPRLSYQNGYRKKWGVFHYLDWNATDKLSIGLFESVIWQDADSAGKRGFDVSYLIPIAFLRPVEFSVGSPDNALMGLNLKYAFTKKSVLFGQFILDELRLKEITSGRGWWGNKFGGQLGFRSNHIFHVTNLNVLTEFNAARPFTFAQKNSLTSYGHYNQPLAHPLGANFLEWINIADYRYKRWFFRAEMQFATYGLDSTNTNFGKNIFKSYESRTNEYGNKIGQGVKTNLSYFNGTVAYLLNQKYNLRLEASLTARNEKNDLIRQRELIFSFGLRSSFRQLYYDF